MESAFEQMGLTARTCHKVLKVARTIADLDGKEKIQTSHLAEAIGYRLVSARGDYRERDREEKRP